MIIFDFLRKVKKSIFGSTVMRLDISNLPSQGLFYKNDFTISIKSVEQIDIDDYKDGSKYTHKINFGKK